jgi:hypothetical protein
MKNVLLGAALAALTATAAYADQFAGIYGNTVNITRPDGSKVVVYVNADKTWEQRTADGKVVKGTFVWESDTKVCFTVTDPKPEKPEDGKSCDEITGNHKAGDTWTETDSKGGKTTISIVAGRS